MRIREHITRTNWSHGQSHQIWTLGKSLSNGLEIKGKSTQTIFSTGRQYCLAKHPGASLVRQSQSAICTVHGVPCYKLEGDFTRGFGQSHMRPITEELKSAFASMTFPTWVFLGSRRWLFWVYDLPHVSGSQEGLFSKLPGDVNCQARP